MTKGEAGIWEKEPGNLKRDIKMSLGNHKWLNIDGV